MIALRRQAVHPVNHVRIGVRADLQDFVVVRDGFGGLLHGVDVFVGQAGAIYVPERLASHHPGAYLAVGPRVPIQTLDHDSVVVAQRAGRLNRDSGIAGIH
jgi:hypothetical protein